MKTNINRLASNPETSWHEEPASNAPTEAVASSLEGI